MSRHSRLTSRNTKMETGGTSSPTGPFVNNARNIHTGSSQEHFLYRRLDSTPSSPSLRNPYILQNVNRARAINMHISISIRMTTIVPRNMTLDRSIIDIAILSWDEAPVITQRSISQVSTKAGISDSRVNANTLCCPNRSRQSITAQIYRGGLSA